MPAILDPTHPIAKLLKRDRRYKFDAYVFIFEALGFAHEVLGMGTERATPEEDAPEVETEPRGEGKKPERHLSGQELCEAIRQFALHQYGYMAKCVLNSWGLHNTGDFGEIVFNMIEIGQMRKTKQDRREDFDNVYSFDDAFVEGFRITAPEKKPHGREAR